jgi:tetratricopeptide (TPR) repeat protein
MLNKNMISNFIHIHRVHLRVVVICLLVLDLSGMAKAQKPTKLRQMAQEAAESGHWDQSYSLLLQAYHLDSSSFDLRTELARASFEIGDYERAAMLFQANYEKDKGQLFKDGLFFLAASQKRLGRYEDAQRNFKTYLKKFKSTGQKYLVEIADHELKSAQWALQYKSNDSTYLQPAKAQEWCTSVSEYPTCVFNDVVWYSQTDSAGIWGVHSTKGINSFSSMLEGDKANWTFCDSSVVYFSRRVEDETKIYRGKWSENVLRDVTAVGELNAAGSYNSMPFIGTYKGERAIYFVSNREGGAGGSDIWYAIESEGRWQKPINAGNRINSQGDEILPSYYNNQLFFASDYHFGFGGMDIFSAVENAGDWSEVMNLGNRVNSSNHDVALHIDINHESYWIASARDNALCLDNLSFGCLDIYQGIWRGKKVKDVDVEDRFYASLKELNAALPVTLYFHNDEPNPRTLDTTSTVTYGDSYKAYLELIPIYLQENTKGRNSEKAEELAALTNDFFDLQVKKGMDDLDLFCELLLKELRSGHSVRIWIRGFASPRAKSDYNLNLTKRRTSSLINHIMALDNGVFLPYIEDKATSGARLEFVQLPFGELKAKAGVSDDLNDISNSIYARSACLERKIEIESVTIMPNTVKEAKLGAYQEVHDFGAISKYQPVKHIFYLPNEGNAPMYIDSIIAECGCTTPELDLTKVLPGEKAQLEVTFDPFGKKGHATKHVTIYIRGMEPRRIRLEAEIEN